MGSPSFFIVFALLESSDGAPIFKACAFLDDPNMRVKQNHTPVFINNSVTVLQLSFLSPLKPTFTQSIPIKGQMAIYKQTHNSVPSFRVRVILSFIPQCYVGLELGTASPLRHDLIRVQTVF